LVYKKKKNELEYQLKIIETEQVLKRALMNPHFLFNSLNSIQNLIIRNENKIARIYIVKISKLMRLILEQSEKQFITLDEEIRTNELYFEMEQLRFKDKFNYEIHIDEKIQRNNIEIPALIIQPFIENSILHGIQNIVEKVGLIKINLSLNEKYLLCEVIDNGVGFHFKDKNEETIIRSKSFGIKSVKERLNNLNSNQNFEEVVMVYERKDNDGNVLGTTASIRIPYNKITHQL
jgi:LytS/YehU family sensor histidine kinase